MPRRRRALRISAARITSCITTVSVTSSSMHDGGTCSSAITSRTRSTRSLLPNWRAETLIPTRRSRRPFAHAHDQPGFLQQRHELIRRQQALAWMLPAYLGLEAHRAATTDIELRLIMQREFATFERAPQFHLHGQLRTALGAHFGNIKLILILALFLGAVHRDVGVLHQHLGALPVLGIERNAERRRDEQLLALADEGLGEGAAHLVHDRRHLFYIEGMIEDHHELIAAAAAMSSW